MDRTARNGRAAPARLLALFAVLVGLLAMHGLASSHHSPAAAAEHPSGPAQLHSAAAVQAHDVQTHDVQAHAPAHHGAAATGSPDQQPTGPLAAPSGPSCDTDCITGLVALCVAVLAAAVIATAVLLRHRARPWGSRPARGTARAPTAARLDPPSPDPVRELCVSRT